MEKSPITSVAFAEFKKANNIVSVSKTVQRSKGNGLFVTFLSSDLHTEGPQKGKAKAIPMWFAKTVVEKGLVSEGQATSELGIGEMIIVNTKNEQLEDRQKLAYAGADNSNYTAI